jgi:ribonuclease HI
MADYLTEKAAAAGAQLDVIVSQVNTDPFRSRRQEVCARLAGTEVRGKKAGSEASRVPSGRAPVRRILSGRALSPDAVESTPAHRSEVGEKQEQDSEASKENPASGFGKLLIYIDGASRGNPGNAAAGVVILDEQQKPVLERKKYLGKTTNNVAEYQALILALQEALDMGAVQVEVKTDSELLANQWNGEYRVQNPGLVPLMQQARRLAGRLQSCKVAHVPRERNKRADALANQAIDEHLKNPGPPGLMP